MSYDIAVFGSLHFDAKTAKAWKALDAAPANRKGWADFAGPTSFQGTVAEALASLQKGPDGAWGWTLEVKPKAVFLRGVMPKDCFLDNGRLLAELWMRGGEAGAKGSLSFRGFETSDAGWIVEAKPGGRVRVMKLAEKREADSSMPMEMLRVAAAELVEKAKRKPVRAAKARTAVGAGVSPAELPGLAEKDPAAAERIVIEWLSDPTWWEDGEHWAQPRAAFETGAALGVRACLDKMVAAFLAAGGGAWMMKVLTAARGPDVGKAIAEALTPDVFRESVAGAHELLEVLVARGEIGDRARIEQIA